MKQRLFTHLIPALLLFVGANLAHGQSESDLEAIQRAAEILKQGGLDRNTEKTDEALRAKLDSEEAAAAKAKILEAAKSFRDANDPESAARRAQAAKIMEAAKARLREQGIDPSAAAAGGIPRGIPAPPSTEASAPIPRAAIATPAAGGVRPAGVPSAAGAPGLQPRDIPRVEEKVKGGAPQATMIKVAGADATSHIDNLKRISVFTGDVFLDQPGFDIWCDQLQIYMKDDKEKAVPVAGAKPGEQTTAIGGGGIKIAVAIGRKVIIQQTSADGKVQLGQCTKAIYYAESETLVMSGWPRVQEGKNFGRATEESTQLVLRKNGQHEFINGKHEINYIDDGEKPLVPGPAAR